MPSARLKINRFTVMAMLQAARARSLGLTQESAYSWGLNRAIFYAAAKRGFRSGSSSEPGKSSTPKEASPTRELYRLGDDEAYRDLRADTLLFTIGDRDQKPEDFDQKIITRFGSKESFEAAWKEAMKIVDGYDPATLQSRTRFYQEVYRPRRDVLSERWAQEYGTAPTTR